MTSASLHPPPLGGPADAGIDPPELRDSADSGGPAAFEELRGGRLGVRLATTPDEVDAVQALRYRIFYDEMGARPDPETARTGRDADRFDAVADHLLVVDHEIGPGADGIVGCYRLIRQSAADQIGRFYSADEYDLHLLDRFEGTVLELGRSCVAPDYRGRAAMQLLWRGIAAYVFVHRIDLMFGCASLPGTDADRLATELSYLHHYHLAPPALRLRALDDRYVDMARLPIEALRANRVLSGLPPLIKGYLRLGGFVGDGAVVDAQFNTTDVAIIVKTELVTDKYTRHYDRDRREID